MTSNLTSNDTEPCDAEIKEAMFILSTMGEDRLTSFELAKLLEDLDIQKLLMEYLKSESPYF